MTGGRSMAVLGAVGVLLLGACGGGSDGEQTTAGPEGSTVATVLATPASAACADGATALAFTRSSYEEGGDLFVLDVDGEARQLSDDGGTYAPALSPDGTQVAVASIGDLGEVSDSFGPSHLELFVHPVDGGERRAVGSSGFATSPTWAPDGSMLAYERTTDGESGDPSEIWVVAADGEGDRRLVTPEAGQWDRDPAWSPDGTKLAFLRGPRFDDGPQRLFVVDVDAGADEVVSADALLEREELSGPAWSPDGERLAVDGSDGRGLGAVQVLDAGEGTEQDALEAASGPSWTSDGRLLAYGGAPGTSDATGYPRVAEFVPDGDGGFAVGLPVPGIEPIAHLYSGYRVAAAPCQIGDAPLTADVDPVQTITVTVPSTGETLTVLDRATILAGRAEAPGAFSIDEPRAKLIEPTQLRMREIESAVPGGAPDVRPAFPGAGPLVWVVCGVDSSCDVVDPTTGAFLMGGGTLAEQFDALEDLAPA